MGPVKVTLEMHVAGGIYIGPKVNCTFLQAFRYHIGSSSIPFSKHNMAHQFLWVKSQNIGLLGRMATEK